jgi:hypothetical protein
MHPIYVRLTSKPCNLPLGVIAVGLLDSVDCGFRINFSIEQLHHLLVTDRAERPRGVAVFLEKVSRFLDQPGIEHSQYSFVDTPIKFSPVGVETDSQYLKTSQWLPAGLPLLAHWLFLGDANFDGANHLGHIIGVNSRSGLSIDSLKNAVQMTGALFVSALAKPLAQFFRALRAGKQSVKQRPQVQTRPANHDR